MAQFDESILNEVKLSLGLGIDDHTFDTDVKIHINSVIGTLAQLGIGPEGGFEIIGPLQTWADFLAEDLDLAPVKSYVYLRVKLLFDPPPNSWITVSYKEQIEQLEWRLNVVREDTIPIEDPSIPDEVEEFELDGGVI